MAETVSQRSRERLSRADMDAIADFIKEERDTRKGKRKHLEALWKEIDRQLDMCPRVREVRSGEKKDWYPDLELPLQANALEVIAADARRLKFPRGTEWYEVSAEISDKYVKRWQDSRSRRPLLSGSGFSMQPDSIEKRLAQQVDLDQETANVLVKVVMDHYHRLYDFREKIDLFDAEMIKYGTGVVRVRPVKTSKFSMAFRGVKSDNIEGPAVIPCSIKNTYLDDTPHAILHEGVMIGPLTLRKGQQRLDSLILAAKRGGAARGWIPKNIDGLKPLNESRHVDIIEGEGDFVVPRTRGSIFLPNFLITVAIGQGSARVVRMRENPMPFRSYVPGYYMREDPATAYGTSPLMKGQPIQEAATEVFNDLLAASRLSSDPPLAYDRFDTSLTAGGGPQIFPGALFPAESPNAVEPLKIGDVGALTAAYLALIKQYEDLTGANDARRGAPVRSHTTTGGIELEASRGIARTDDFVTAVEQGPMRTILYMEWEIIKSVMSQSTPISVGTGGIEGWINVSKPDLPDNVVFHINGSAGVLNEREMAQNFVAASQFVLSLAPIAAQLGQPMPIRFTEIAAEAYKRSGVQNAQRFIGEGPGAAIPTPVEPGLQGPANGSAPDFSAPMGQPGPF